MIYKIPYLCFFLIHSTLVQVSAAKSSKEITNSLLQDLTSKDYKQRVSADNVLYAYLDTLETGESIKLVISFLKTQTHPQIKSSLSKYLKKRVLFYQEKSLLGVSHAPTLISLKGKKICAMRIESTPLGQAAEKSGLRQYDQITKINGEEILLKELQTANHFDDDLASHHFSYLIKKHKPGTTITIEVLRDGVTLITKEVKLTACKPFKTYFIEEKNLTQEILKEIGNSAPYTNKNRQDIYYKFWSEEFLKNNDAIIPLN